MQAFTHTHAQTRRCPECSSRCWNRTSSRTAPCASPPPCSPSCRGKNSLRHRLPGFSDWRATASTTTPQPSQVAAGAVITTTHTTTTTLTTMTPERSCFGCSPSAQAGCWQPARLRVYLPPCRRCNPRRESTPLTLHNTPACECMSASADQVGGCAPARLCARCCSCPIAGGPSEHNDAFMSPGGIIHSPRRPPAHHFVSTKQQQQQNPPATTAPTRPTTTITSRLLVLPGLAAGAGAAAAAVRVLVQDEVCQKLERIFGPVHVNNNNKKKLRDGSEQFSSIFNSPVDSRGGAERNPHAEGRKQNTTQQNTKSGEDSSCGWSWGSARVSCNPRLCARTSPSPARRVPA